MNNNFFLTILIFLFPCLVYSQIIQINMGKVDEVEFIGLEKFTPQMILDSLTNCTDSTCIIDNVYKIYCNACLKKTLPFPSIHVTSRFKNNKKLFVSMSIVEPQYANLVRYLELPHNEFPIRNEWEVLIKTCNIGDISFLIGIQLYNKLFYKKDDNFIDSSLSVLANEGFDTNSISKYWKIIHDHNKDGDFKNAIFTLENDGNFENRKAAICILLNFIEKEQTYSMLFNLFRTRSTDKENALTSMVFRSFLNSEIPQLDIALIEEAIVPLLNGTNIQQFIPIMEFLSSVPNIDMETRKIILENSKRLCIAYLKSNSYGNQMKEILESIAKTKFTNIAECIDYLN